MRANRAQGRCFASLSMTDRTWGVHFDDLRADRRSITGPVVPFFVPLCLCVGYLSPPPPPPPSAKKKFIILIDTPLFEVIIQIAWGVRIVKEGEL